MKNKIVLITGASSGIGRACATQFAKLEAKLILVARRSDKIDELAHLLKQKYNSEIYKMVLDIRDSAKVKAAFDHLPENWRSIDILINNAGLAKGLDFLQDGEIEDWEAMIDTNVKGLLYITKAILPKMVARNSGHIVNIGSIAGHQVYPKGGVYCATKFAINALSQGMRMDLLGSQIRVSSIDPGAVETEFSEVRFKGDKERANAVYKGMHPLKPEDVADVVIYCVRCPPHVNLAM